MQAEPTSLCFDFNRYPYLTAGLAGVGGRIRQETRDFQVEEVPEAPLAGVGEHLHLQIEKELLTTREVVDHLRRSLGVPEEAIGFAGLKDKRALTRQWISVPAACAEAVAAIAPLPGLRVLEQGLHDKKLQKGYLAGNRFRLLLRDVHGDAAAARAILEALSARGVPNYFGPQRFGRDRRNAERGLAIARAGRGRARHWRDKLMINSLQSLVFNEWAALRLERGLFDRVIHGDVAMKRETGGKFLVGDPDAEQARAERFEISATGPLPGKKYHEAQFAARAIEDEVLARFGLAREDFLAVPGSRRAIRVPLADWRLEEAPEGLWIAFFLPAGAYATAVLREVMKADPEAGLAEPGEGDE